MEYTAWTDGCKIDTGGWRASSEQQCGADTYPWIRFEDPEQHWKRVEEQERLQRVSLSNVYRMGWERDGVEGKDLSCVVMVSLCVYTEFTQSLHREKHVVNRVHQVFTWARNLTTTTQIHLRIFFIELSSHKRL